jgi:hypothetical protein
MPAEPDGAFRMSIRKVKRVVLAMRVGDVRVAGSPRVDCVDSRPDHLPDFEPSEDCVKRALGPVPLQRPAVQACVAEEAEEDEQISSSNALVGKVTGCTVRLAEERPPTF